MLQYYSIDQSGGLIFITPFP